MNKITYEVQNFKKEIEHVGKIIKGTKVAYTWDFDVRMSDKSFIKDDS